MPDAIEIDETVGMNIGAAATAYSNGVFVKGARQVVWHIIAGDATPLASITAQVSEDDTNYYDAAAAHAVEGAGASTEDLSIGQVHVLRSTDVSASYIPWKYARLKMVGGAGTNGVQVTGLVVNDQ